MNKSKLSNFAPYVLSSQFYKLNLETNSQYSWVLETTGLYIHHPQFLYNTLGEPLKGVLPASYYNDAIPVYLLEDFIFGNTGIANLQIIVGKSGHCVDAEFCVTCGIKEKNFRNYFCAQELRDVLLDSAAPWGEFYRYSKRLGLND